MKGMNPRMQALLATCNPANFNDLIRISINVEEKQRVYMEDERKKHTSTTILGNPSQHQRVVHQPIFKQPYRPPQQEFTIPSRYSQQHKLPTQPKLPPQQAPLQANALVFHNAGNTRAHQCYNCGNMRPFIKVCRAPRQYNAPWQQKLEATR